MFRALVLFVFDAVWLTRIRAFIAAARARFVRPPKKKLNLFRNKIFLIIPAVSQISLTCLIAWISEFDGWFSSEYVVTKKKKQNYYYEIK
jgi:hypothetical protein